MPLLSLPRPAALSIHGFHRLGLALTRFCQRRAAARRWALDRQQLLDMSPAELRDIGLARDQIECCRPPGLRS